MIDFSEYVSDWNAYWAEDNRVFWIPGIVIAIAIGLVFFALSVYIIVIGEYARSAGKPPRYATRIIHSPAIILPILLILLFGGLFYLRSIRDTQIAKPDETFVSAAEKTWDVSDFDCVGAAASVNDMQTHDWITKSGLFPSHSLPKYSMPDTGYWSCSWTDEETGDIITDGILRVDGDKAALYADGKQMEAVND